MTPDLDRLQSILQGVGGFVVVLVAAIGATFKALKGSGETDRERDDREREERRKLYLAEREADILRFEQKSEKVVQALRELMEHRLSAVERDIAVLTSQISRPRQQ